MTAATRTHEKGDAQTSTLVELKVAEEQELSSQRRQSRQGLDSKFEDFTNSLRGKRNTQKTASLSSTVEILGTDILDDAKISRVERSWYLISHQNRIGVVGEAFFLKMFAEYPELVQLFPFGDDSVDHETGKLILNDRTKRHVRAHAGAVMRTVGTCVAGLTTIQDLVPRLRTVGLTHKMVGVQNMHYDILYRHLIQAIRDEVGSGNWDQETEDAWEQAFLSITDLIKSPSKRLDTEPLRGWGIVMLSACIYFTIVTPFRFAGFYIGHANVIMFLDSLDLLAALIMLFDLMVDLIQSKFLLGKKHLTPRNDADDDSSVDSWLRRRRSKAARSFLQAASKNHRAMINRLQTWEMDRWVPWPSLDIRVLLSFVLQGIFYRGSLCSSPGLHWTQLFGLLRVSCVSRVMHFLQCAENNALLDQKLDSERQLILRVTKLLVRLAFITHVGACMWCAVARVGLGPMATEFEPSPFFPNPEVLYGEGRNVFNSYSRAIHWAFVNLSGIGGVESVPNTSLECWLVICIHVIGAIFYAIVTGNVIAVLEDASNNENKIGLDIARLSHYLTTARVSEVSKERIMKGYMMRNVLTEGSGSGPVVDELLDSNDEVLGTLPNYLRQEVGIYARAEVIRRRDKFFTHCSNGFLVALSTTLSSTRTLLTGDYLLKKDEAANPEFGVIDSGTLQVRRDRDTVQTLRRGDCIGKAWLIQFTNDSLSPEEFSEDTDWLKKDGRAGVSIRAMSPCVIMTGLSTVEEIRRLERGYKVDFKLLRAEARGRNIDDSDRKAMAMRGIAKAVRLFRARREQQKRISLEKTVPKVLASQCSELSESSRNVALADGDQTAEL